MPRLLPTSDQAVGSWSISPLWSKVDDDSVVAAAGDGVTITSDAVGNNTNTSNADIRLASGTDPARSNDHVIRVRWSRSGTQSLQAHCELWQGVPGTGTMIASLDSATDVGATEVAAELTLTGTQADSITDYTDLYLRLWGRGTGSGAARSLIVELAELAIPAVLTQHQKVSYDSEADSTTHSLTITEPVAGRLMVLVACASAVLNTPTDWSLAISATNDPDVRIFYRIAPASFGTTVQFGSNSSCSASAVYMEYSGIDTSAPLDQTASQTGVAQTGTTGTTAQPDELLIGALGNAPIGADNNWSAWANSFTEEHDLASSGSSFNVSLGVATRVVSAIGTYGTSATSGGSGGPCGCIATFKVGAASSGEVTGSGAASAAPAEVSGTGQLVVSASGSAAAQAAEASGTAAVEVTASGAALAAAASVDGTGQVLVAGSGAAAAPPARVSGTGSVGDLPVTGSGAAAAPAARVAGSATVIDPGQLRDITATAVLTARWTGSLTNGTAGHLPTARWSAVLEET